MINNTKSNFQTNTSDFDETEVSPWDLPFYRVEQINRSKRF